jgi:hypothetical protein
MNRFLWERYIAEFNRKFTVAPAEQRTAFSALPPNGPGLDLHDTE